MKHIKTTCDVIKKKKRDCFKPAVTTTAILYFMPEKCACREKVVSTLTTNFITRYMLIIH